MKYLRRACILMVVLHVGASFCWAQDADVPEPDVVISTSLSAALNIGSTLECFLTEEAYFPALFLGTVTLQNIPSFIYGSEGAFLNGGIQLGLDGLYFANELAFGSNMASPVLFNFAHKYSMFATYATYTDLRSRTANPDYSEIPSYSLGELLTAPFRAESYHWSVLGYIGSIALVTGIEMAMVDQSSAVWTTGRSFIGNVEFPVWAGAGLILLLQVPNFIMTGIGEECYFRGTVYEELSYRLGEWPAKITDSLYFTLCHYPQQWDQIMARPAMDSLINIALSMSQAMWFQYIYEWKGLGAAITAHALSDIVSLFCDWLIRGGVPNDSGFSINDRVLSISFTQTL